jgi:Protein of unknown function (DUF983)
MAQNILTGLVNNTCPRCAVGQVFVAKNPYSIGKMTAMNDTCPHCELKFEREPGFFFGSMYISYAINIGFFVIGLILYFNVLHVSLGTFAMGYLGLMAMLFPITFRISRSIWLHIFTDFDPTKKGKR